MTEKSIKATENKRAGLEERLASLEQEIAEREAELASAKEEAEKKSEESREHLDTLQRMQAEYENFRKRMVREQTQVVEFATQKLICELLPLVDNLERAVSAADDGHDMAQVAEGVNMIHEQLKGTLQQSGLEVIDPCSEAFNPEYHEAVLQVESEEHDENTVVEVLQKGYCLKGKVLRPAMVKVTKKS